MRTDIAEITAPVEAVVTSHPGATVLPNVRSEVDNVVHTTNGALIRVVGPPGAMSCVVVTGP